MKGGDLTELTEIVDGQHERRRGTIPGANQRCGRHDSLEVVGADDQ